MNDTQQAVLGFLAFAAMCILVVAALTAPPSARQIRANEATADARAEAREYYCANGGDDACALGR